MNQIKFINEMGPDIWLEILFVCILEIIFNLLPMVFVEK